MVTIDIQNIKEIKDAIAQHKNIMPRIKFALEQFLIKVTDVARLKCPVKTGTLQRSIERQIIKSTDESVEGRVGSNLKYACLIGYNYEVYHPNSIVTTQISRVKIGDMILSKDGNPHKVIKTHKFKILGDSIEGIEIKFRTNRKNPIFTKTHLLLILRNNNLIWEQVQNLKLTDMVFVKRMHNDKRNFCVCGKEITGINKSMRLYCSIECRNKYMNWKSFCGGNKSHFYKDGRTLINNKCKICGKRIWFEASYCKEHSPHRQLGEENPLFIKENRIYDWRFNRKLKIKILKRDNYTCQICGETNRLSIHHKDRNKMNSKEENLITLCGRCHGLVTMGKLDCELPEINLDVFKPVKILDIKKIIFKRKYKIGLPHLYDLSIENENSFLVAGVLSHNSYIEFGTGVYGPRKTPIRPVNKKVLAFVTSGARPTSAAAWNKAQKDGRVVYAKEVRGIKPRPYLLPAFNETLNSLVDFIKKAMK